MSRHTSPGRIVDEAGQIALGVLQRMAAELSGLLTDCPAEFVTEANIADAAWLLEQFARLGAATPPPLEPGEDHCRACGAVITAGPLSGLKPIGKCWDCIDEGAADEPAG